MHRSVPARAASLYAAALLTFFYLFVPPGGYARMLEGKFVCYLVLSAVFVLGAARGLLRRPRAEEWFALAFWALCVLSSLCSVHGEAVLLGGSRRVGLVTLTLYVLTFLLLRRYLRPAQWMLPAVAVGAALCSALVLAQTLGLGWFYPAGLGYWDGDVKYPGFFAGVSGNIDFTAYLLAVAACVLAAAWLRPRARRQHWLLAPLFLSLCALLRLRVAGALVGLGAAALLSPALLFPRRRRLWMRLSAAAGALALLVLLCFPFSGGTLLEVQLTLRGQGEAGFGSGRLGIWRAVGALVCERPLLGGGPGTLALRGLEPMAWMQNGQAVALTVSSAHNEYLALAADVGIPALFCALALPVLALRRAMQSKTRCAAVCAPALLCALVGSFFAVESCITAPYVILLLALLLRDGDARTVPRGENALSPL